MRNKKATVPDPNKMFTCAGERFAIDYQPIVNRDGTVILEEAGTIDIWEKINSFKDQTDIAYIMKRLTMGDFSVLNPNEGIYGDFRNIPTDPAEVKQYQINAEKYFYNLPPDIRNKFNNSVVEFLREGQNESEFFFNALGIESKKGDDIVSAESSD